MDRSASTLLTPGILLRMGGQPAQRPTVRISAQVVAGDDLEHRLQSVAAQLDQSRDSASHNRAGQHVSALESRADRLHRHWLALSPPAIHRRPGPAGRAANLTKRTVRRLTAWYVEPRWEVQREFDAEAARLATDTADAIRLLRNQIEDLQFTNERLLRRLHTAEQATSRLTPPVGVNVER